MVCLCAPYCSFYLPSTKIIILLAERGHFGSSSEDLVLSLGLELGLGLV